MSVDRRYLHQAAPRPDEATIYVDSRTLLQLLREKGDKGRALSFSPSLYDDVLGDVVADSAELSLTPQRIRELEDACLDLAARVGAEPTLSEWQRLLAARVVINPLQQFLPRAAVLSESDYREPVTLVRLVNAPPVISERFNSCLPELLQSNPALKVVNVDVSILPPTRDPTPGIPGLLDRVRFAGPKAILLRTGMWLSGRLGAFFPRGTILVLRENELVKETALALLKRGYSVQRVAFGKKAESDRPLAGKMQADALLRKHAVESFSSLLSPSAVDAVARLYAQAVIQQFERFESGLPAWRSTLNEFPAGKVKAVLSNFIISPEFVALAAVLRERGIGLAVFQHGVTVEYNARTRRYWPIFETTLGDLALVFNRSAAAVMNGPKWSHAVSVGAPADYFRGSRLRPLRDAPPVWYISTAVYLGTFGLLAEGVSDRDKWKHERAMLDQVLSRLPHKVLYKPYPADRYLDQDPVISRAQRYGNVTVWNARIDLRYIVGSARVLVTSRAWSTLSWCVASGRPTVFFDIPDQAEMAQEVRSRLQEGLFYFDGSDPGALEALQQFLSQPISEIERQWAERANARAAMIAELFWERSRGAGDTAASAIEAMIASMEASHDNR